MMGVLDELQNFAQPFVGAEGKRIGQDYKLRRGTTLFKILVDLGKTGTIFSVMIYFTKHRRVLDSSLSLISLSDRFLGFLTTLLNKIFF